MQAECCICIGSVNQPADNATDEDHPVATKCGHIFHHSCLTTWLKQKAICPSCKHSVRKGSYFRLFVDAARLSGEGTAARVCGLVQGCCELLTVGVFIKELVRILPSDAQLLDRAFAVSNHNGWWGGKETELGQLVESHPWASLEAVGGAADQMVAALGEEKMRQVLAEVVQHYALATMHKPQDQQVV